jgi:N-acetylmuramoyl-L-alanine amidase
MRPIDLIVVHCSDSRWGDVATIRKWHTDPPPAGRGWDDIGYHYVIQNGFPTSVCGYLAANDGLLEEGRPVAKVGAHVYGHNDTSIGVCLVGGRDRQNIPCQETWVTERQRAALLDLLRWLMGQYPQARLLGHHELDPGKGCPMLDMDRLRAEL